MKSGCEQTSNKLGTEISVEPIESAVLHHIAGHRLTVKAAWQLATELSTFDGKQIGKAVKKLVRLGFVEVGWLHHGAHYFVLSSRGAELLGKNIPHGLLNESAKLVAYGRLLLATKYRPELSFEQSEKTAEFLGFASNGLGSCFAKSREAPGLTFVRIDKAFASRPSRSAQTIRSDILRLAKRAPVVELMKRKQLEYLWCTATEARARATIREFRSYQNVGSSPVKQLIVPELLSLVCSSPALKEVLARKENLPRQ